MITKKLCEGCRSLRVIWKNHEGKRYCKQCWGAHSGKPKPIPTVKQKRLPSRSSKRIKQDAEYLKLRRSYLDHNPLCQVHLSGLCTSVGTDIHHTYSGKDRSKYYLDIKTWLTVCRGCHNWIHDNSKIARELGYLK